MKIAVLDSSFEEPNTPDSPDPSLQWCAELRVFANSGTSYDAASSLRRLGLILNSFIAADDSLEFCKADFEHAVRNITSNTHICNHHLRSRITTFVKMYFSSSYFSKLPADLVVEVFLWLSVEEFSPIFEVCKDWNEIGSSNGLWKELYLRKFFDLKFERTSFLVQSEPFIKSQFLSRVEDPMIGDRVQVRWRGNFRLSAVDTYIGVAWWAAEVVDKKPKGDAPFPYKIRFPGWDSSRWDQWLCRSDMRWPVARNLLDHVRVGDSVEIWCLGKNVPGAWLEGEVGQVDSGQYMFNNLLQSGSSLTVSRRDLRKRNKQVRRKSILDDIVNFNVSISTHSVHHSLPHHQSCLVA